MPSLITTMLGLAMVWRRAARFGVSPTMLGVRLPTTTTPVAMPTLTCWGTRVFRVSDSRDEFEPGSYRLLGVVFMSVRIAEVYQDTVPHVLSDGSAELAHGFFGAS